MQPQIFISSHTYHSTLDALEVVAANHDPNCTYSVSILRTRLIEALGEIGCIWPASAYDGGDDLAATAIFAMPQAQRS